MCLCLVSCHSYSNSLRHATFSHCLNPSQPCAFDPIKLIIKTEPLRSCRKWQAISEESFVHKIKMSLNIAPFKVGGARPPLWPNTQHIHSNRRWSLTIVLKRQRGSWGGTGIRFRSKCKGYADRQGLINLKKIKMRWTLSANKGWLTASHDQKIIVNLTFLGIEKGSNVKRKEGWFYIPQVVVLQLIDFLPPLATCIARNTCCLPLNWSDTNDEI